MCRAALQKTELNTAYLLKVKALLQIICKLNGKTAELRMSESIRAGSFSLRNKRAVGVMQSLRYCDKNISLLLHYLYHIIGKSIEIKSYLGQVYKVGATSISVFSGKSRTGCQPAGMTAHYLNNGHHVGIIYIGILADLHAGSGNKFCRASEAGTMVGSEKIVVDSFGNSHNAALISYLLHVLAYLIAGIHGIVSAIIEKVPHVIFFKYLKNSLIIAVIHIRVSHFISA